MFFRNDARESFRIRATIERGKALSVSDHADFLKQGGDLLIAELSTILEGKLSYLDNLRAETCKG